MSTSTRRGPLICLSSANVCVSRDTGNYPHTLQVNFGPAKGHYPCKLRDMGLLPLQVSGRPRSTCPCKLAQELTNKAPRYGAPDARYSKSLCLRLLKCARASQDRGHLPLRTTSSCNSNWPSRQSHGKGKRLLPTMPTNFRQTYCRKHGVTQSSENIPTTLNAITRQRPTFPSYHADIHTANLLHKHGAT